MASDVHTVTIPLEGPVPSVADMLAESLIRYSTVPVPAEVRTLLIVKC